MTDLRPHRRTAAALLAVAGILVAAVLVAPAPAGAARATSCAKQIVNDWYGDGRVDRIYPLHCYREAIRSLGVDLKIYSGAEDDILRALAFAKQGETDPGDAGGVPGKGDGNGKGNGNGNGNGNGGETTTTDETVAGPSIDTSGPSSIPLPLILLAGLALLLLAAGGAGYVSRRAEARRADGPDDGEL